MANYIWLIGENLGNTANNNSFYFWRNIVKIEDGIDKYYILEKNAENNILYDQMCEDEKKYIVWKNSIRHFQLYMKADMFFVTLSYRDVRPENFYGKKMNFLTVTPVIYLQHGTLAIKQLGYNGRDYNNNMFRFLYYNPHIKTDLINVNGFKEYQLYDGQFHPRYQELVRKHLASPQSNTILWFVTWREYFGENFATKKFLYQMRKILSDKKLQNFLDINNVKLKLCLHTFFDSKRIEELFSEVTSENITWIHANNTDIMDEIVQSKLLITDYSSLGFDFTFLNKPVLLYAPDFDEYMRKRKMYCEPEEYQTYSINSAEVLIEKIISGDYQVNPFFKNRLPENINYEYILSGAHIIRIYEYFKNIQEHRVTFLGYNFYGNGGTVSATYALGEGLLERGYLVQLISLKQNVKASNVPYGMNMKALYDAKSHGKIELLKKALFRNKKFYGYLHYDKDEKNLIPYAGYALKKWLDEAGSETVISTRDSLHPFLVDGISNRIKNKLYFYHCSATVFDEIFPGLSEQLKEHCPDKAIFVTENNRKALIELFGFEPYKKYISLGNSLSSFQVVSKDDIKAVPEKECYTGVFLLRISQERKDDIETLFKFGKFLKEHEINNIKIYVYGTGNYLNTFLDGLIINEVTDYIKYCGFTRSPKAVLKKYDAVIDFSKIQSFGMTYIEGIFNGKMVFCPRNTGSLEVFDEIPYAFYDNFEELVDKMQKLPNISEEELKTYYEILAAKYSRSAIADKLIKYMNE